jgi:signal transduction histidine kinase
MYSYTHGEYIDEARVAISATTYKYIQILGVISILLMSLVVLISFFISFYVVNRINIIASTANEIIETADLSRRISINKRWDDLSNLAYILNHMLSKIEQLMIDVRQVSDNIAHDLRTPLTRLRNHLENARNESSNPEEISKIINEADAILQTFNALLRITNIEKSKRHIKFSEVKLSEIINDVIELYEPLAEEKNISIKTKLDFIGYAGDKDLIFQLLANILDNSIKFTPQNGSISFELKNANKKPLIIISDSGIGIEDSEKKKVFDRFYRSDKSRNSDGSGLGLSLVQAIINLHKAKIELFDNHPCGLTTKIYF